MKPVDYALIWHEEQDILQDYASHVPRNGVIVEIGTALGGTARLMHEASRRHEVRIFTIDIAPFKDAFDNLKGTSVTQITASSAAAAVNWTRDYHLPIDLLYIDGNHSFEGVFQDLLLWSPHLRPGATVVFHDYDPPERGGIAHFAVRVCLDTLLRLKLLGSAQRAYKLLAGTVSVPGAANLSIAECFITLRRIAEEVVSFRESCFSKDVRGGLGLLKTRPQGCDSLAACYCLDYALTHDFEAVALSSDSKGDFRRWAEALYMLDYGYGSSPFPDSMDSLSVPDNCPEMSRFIAREQVRIGLLALILRTVVPWNV